MLTTTWMCLTSRWRESSLLLALVHIILQLLQWTLFQGCTLFHYVLWCWCPSPGLCMPLSYTLGPYLFSVFSFLALFAFSRLRFIFSYSPLVLFEFICRDLWLIPDADSLSYIQKISFHPLLVFGLDGIKFTYHFLCGIGILVSFKNNFFLIKLKLFLYFCNTFSLIVLGFQFSYFCLEFVCIWHELIT